MLLVIRFCLITATVGWLATAMASERVDQLIQDTLQLEPNLASGERLYREHCAACHGRNALGSAKQAVPALAGQRQAYLVKQLADFLTRGRNSAAMHGVLARAGMDEPQTWMDVAAHLNSLRPRVAAVASSKASPGERQYVQWCTECHGSDGRGDEDGFVPSLRHQHGAYLLQEMRALSQSHRTNADQDFMRFLDQLDAREMYVVATYLATMRGPLRDLTKIRNDGRGGD